MTEVLNSPIKLNTEVNTIKSIANHFLQSNSGNEIVKNKARTALAIPVEYMRWAEFSSIRDLIKFEAGDQILDIGSPQWYSLVMAKLHPEVQFTYVNIMQEEIEPFSIMADCCDIKNIVYKIEDARKLGFQDNTFDKVVSISALEHVYPESGGDVQAFAEIKRVLKPNGKLYLTMPYKEKSNIVYRNAPVYERSDPGKKFYAREYDHDTFQVLLQQSGFKEETVWYIYEKKGFLALDYHSYGPGSHNFLGRRRRQAVRALDLRLKLSLTEKMAKKYLNVSREPKSRLVNISIELSPVTT